MTKVHIPGQSSTAGKTDHTQQQRGKQDVSLKTLPVSDPHAQMTAWSLKQKKKQPCHRRHDIKKVSPLCGHHEYNISSVLLYAKKKKEAQPHRRQMSLYGGEKEH